MNKFELYEKDLPIRDSMCYDSGTYICSYKEGNRELLVAVRGFVKVWYQDTCYRHFSEMPDELKQKFITGEAYKFPENAIISENNWFEYIYTRDGNEVYNDVFDIPTPINKEQLEKICQELMDECIEIDGEENGQ